MKGALTLKVPNKISNTIDRNNYKACTFESKNIVDTFYKKLHSIDVLFTQTAAQPGETNLLGTISFEEVQLIIGQTICILLVNKDARIHHYFFVGLLNFNGQIKVDPIRVNSTTL